MAEKNTAPTVDGQPRAPITLRLDQALVTWAKDDGLNPAGVLEAELLRLKAKRTAEQRRAEKAAARRVGGQGFAGLK
jgi:hypothetical protein